MTKQMPADPSLDVFLADDVRAIDGAAIDGGIDGYELMTRAGRFALEVALREFRGARRWQVICGAGNNAGDGYLVARLAQEQGIEVSVCHVSSPDDTTGDAREAWQDAVRAGVRIDAFDRSLDANAELLVDAMLGSGLARDVAGRYAKAVAAINAHHAPVLAIDVPTGIHGDSGAVMGVAVEADVTATFVGRKAGLYLAAGPDHAGEVHFSSLDVPPAAYAGRRAQMRLADPLLAQRHLRPRPRQSHKGHFGHVLVVGGGPGMPGAARLAGEAALRVGAGRVSVAVHPDSAAAIAAGRPELMCHALPEGAGLERLLGQASVVALGPGLGRDAWARSLFGAAGAARVPVVVDADGLNLLAETPGERADRVLTPHPGEAARLLGCTAAGVQADRCDAVARLRARYGGTVVLKGCNTLVATGEGPPRLVTSGNPAMASAGMGDVLTGVIAGLIAQGLPPVTAAVLGADVHARAGDTAARGDSRGLLATDVLRALRAQVNPA